MLIYIKISSTSEREGEREMERARERERANKNRRFSVDCGTRMPMLLSLYSSRSFAISLSWHALSEHTPDLICLASWFDSTLVALTAPRKFFVRHSIYRVHKWMQIYEIYRDATDFSYRLQSSSHLIKIKFHSFSNFDVPFTGCSVPSCVCVCEVLYSLFICRMFFSSIFFYYSYSDWRVCRSRRCIVVWINSKLIDYKFYTVKREFATTEIDREKEKVKEKAKERQRKRINSK